MGESFKNLMEKLKPVFQFFTTYVMAVIQGALSAVAPIISAVKNAIDFVSNIISAFMALFRGDLDGFSQYIEAALKNLIEIVKNLITAVVNYIITFFQTFGVDVKKISLIYGPGLFRSFQASVRGLRTSSAQPTRQ